MRGRTKLVSLATLITILVTSSMVFASGVIDASKVSLLSQPPMEPMAGSPRIFIDPNAIIKDYVLDPGYQIGNILNVRVNVSDVTDLFSYQVNLTWTTSMLNFTGVTYGDVLSSTGSPYGSSGAIEKIAPAYNETGTALVAETILGNVAGVSKNGTLFTAQFEILGYGCARIYITTGGLFPTLLLDSAGADITPTAIGNGYFKNKLQGDANGDRIVNVADMGVTSARWTGAPGTLPYDRDSDCNDDGVHNVADMGVTSANWLRSG